MVNLIAPDSASRLTRHLENPAADVIEPAVIQASKPAVFDTPVAQIRSAMRAVKPEQSRSSGIIAEKNQFFSEDADLQRGTFRGQFFRKGHGLPVASHQITAGRAATRFGEKLIFFGGNHQTPHHLNARDGASFDASVPPGF